jgi:hypothetical protein
MALDTSYLLGIGMENQEMSACLQTVFWFMGWKVENVWF